MNVTPPCGSPLLSFLLPAPCVACGQLSEGGPLGLCSACRSLLQAPGEGCHQCGRELAGPLLTAYRCGRCRAEPPAFSALVAAWRYQPPMDSVIAALKYRRLEYLGRHLAHDLLARLAPAAPYDFVVAVPLHFWRRWNRGFNQAERIAEEVAAGLRLDLASALSRCRATPSQTRLTRAQRRANLAAAFRVRRGQGARLVGRHVLLIDDVATTGATLNAAARALCMAGVGRVTAAVAALTPEPGDRV
ncbi:MAG: ComF family protein [Thermoanaerobaculia bacterium]|nr:ComF family protein [Thermoanaerobaculia bacterium]